MKTDTTARGSAARERASGRFLLRLDPGLHALLRAAAAAVGMSLNDYCARRLASPASGAAVLDAATACVARAARLFGAKLLGVVLFGSWARAQGASTSDIDLLVVLDPSITLTRELYRRWDQEPLIWREHSVEVHFTHLPQKRKRPGSLWAEVALDGVIVFERELRLSRRLAEVRREILTGRLVRRTAQSQPYWIEVT
jgi:hypothetical protein